MTCIYPPGPHAAAGKCFGLGLRSYARQQLQRISTASSMSGIRWCRSFCWFGVAKMKNALPIQDCRGLQLLIDLRQPLAPNLDRRNGSPLKAYPLSLQWGTITSLNLNNYAPEPLCQTPTLAASSGETAAVEASRLYESLAVALQRDRRLPEHAPEPRAGARLVAP